MTINNLTLSCTLAANLGLQTLLAAEVPIVSASKGHIIIEAESAENLGEWIRHGSNDQFSWLKGFSGDGCLQFTGNEEHSGDPNSILTYRFKVDAPGDYKLQARALEAPLETKEGDKANDCYVRLLGAPQYKGEFTKFVLLGDSFEWSWNVKLESSYHQFESPIYTLKPGVYQLQIAGRSKNFFLDRLVIYPMQGDERARDLSISSRAFVEEAAESGDYFLSAINDFKPVIAPGLGKVYVDKNRKAVAVNAANESLRDVFSAVGLTFEGRSGNYDVEIKTLTETDGESVYRFVLNGERIGTYKNPATAIDYSPSYNTWQGIAIKKGDRLRIDSKPETNGKIPEGDGTAWSRGRWVALKLKHADH